MGKRGATNEAGVVGAIYEAALDPAGWPGVLDAIADYMQASSAILYCEDVQNRQASFFVENVGFSAKQIEQYSGYYIFLEPGFQFRKNKSPGAVSAGNLLMTDAEFAETEYYQDYLINFGLFYTAGGLVARDGTRQSVVGIQRPRGMGGFTPRDLRRLGRLVPHLGRAAQIGRMFAREQGTVRAYESLLERIPQGIVLLSAERRIVYMNRAAADLLAEKDGLYITRFGLAAELPAEHRALEGTIRAAAATAQGSGDSAGGAMRVNRSSGKVPHRVLVLPLPTREGPVGLAKSHACVAVVIGNQTAPLLLDTEKLKLLFGLTRAEAALVQALMDGLTPDEYAQRSEKSMNTVRTQIKNIHAKVGVNRQSQLIKAGYGQPGPHRAQAGGLMPSPTMPITPDFQ